MVVCVRTNIAAASHVVIVQLGAVHFYMLSYSSLGPSSSTCCHSPALGRPNQRLPPRCWARSWMRCRRTGTRCFHSSSSSPLRLGSHLWTDTFRLRWHMYSVFDQNDPVCTWCPGSWWTSWGCNGFFQSNPQTSYILGRVCSSHTLDRRSGPDIGATTWPGLLSSNPWW